MPWIRSQDLLPVSEHAKEYDYTRVLIHCPRVPHAHIGYYIASLDEWRIEGSNSDFDVTHWQYLPERPKHE